MPGRGLGRPAPEAAVLEVRDMRRALAEYGALLRHKPLHVLDIPDDYPFMDPELVTLLEQAVNGLLDLS